MAPRVLACRIVYEGQGVVHADGSDEADLRRWRLKRRADSALQACVEPTPENTATAKRTGAGGAEARQTGAASSQPEHPSTDSGHESEAGEGEAMDEEGKSGEGSDIEDALEAALDAAACGDVSFSSEGEWGSSSSGDVERPRGAGGSDSDSGSVDLEGCEEGVSFVELKEGGVARARGSGGGGVRKGGKTRRNKAKARGTALPASASDRAVTARDDDATPDSFSQVQRSSFIPLDFALVKAYAVLAAVPVLPRTHALLPTGNRSFDAEHIDAMYSCLGGQHRSKERAS